MCTVTHRTKPYQLAILITKSLDYIIGFETALYKTNIHMLILRNDLSHITYFDCHVAKMTCHINVKLRKWPPCCVKVSGCDRPYGLSRVITLT